MLTHRVATTRDAPALARMNHQLIRDEGHGNPMTVEQLEERMERWLKGEYTAVMFEEGGQAVAYGLFREEEGAVYLRQFFVGREHRRRGIGRGAMRLLLENVLRSTPKVTLEVLIGNQTAREFWSAVGFHDYAVTMEFLRLPPPKQEASHE